MKRASIAACLLVGIVSLLSLAAPALAADGQLQLDTGVITDSDAGAGSSSDFPIKDQLFSPELDQAAKQAKVNEDKLSSTAANGIDFSSKPDKSKPVGDYADVVAKLFPSDYTPVDLSAQNSSTQQYDVIWYVLIIAGGVVLIPVAIWLGIWNSNRTARKRHRKEQAALAEAKAAEAAKTGETIPEQSAEIETETMARVRAQYGRNN